MRGMCADCGKPTEGSARCPPCIEKQRIRQHRYYLKLKAERPEAFRARLTAGNELAKARGWPNQRAYRLAHPELVKASYQRWYEQYGREWKRNWRKAHPDQVKAIKSLRRAIRRGAVGDKVLVKQLLERDGEECALCGNTLADDYTLDHLKPVSLGGNHYIWNLQLAHMKCNQSRGNKGFIEWALKDNMMNNNKERY